MKIIPETASVHAKESLWRREICDEERLHRADLESEAHICDRLCAVRHGVEENKRSEAWNPLTQSKLNIQE